MFQDFPETSNTGPKRTARYPDPKSTIAQSDWIGEMPNFGSPQSRAPAVLKRFR